MKTIFDNPGYQAATALLNELTQAQAIAQRDESELLAQLCEIKPVGPIGALERARQMLAGKPEPQRQALAGLQHRLTLCREKLALLNDAIQEQRGIMAGLVHSGSAIANSEAKQAHIKAAQGIKTALAGLKSAMDSEASIRREIGAAGFQCSLEPLERPTLNCSDDQSDIGRFAKDVSDYLQRCETQSKKTVNVRVLCACNAGAVGDVVTLPGSVAADLVHQGQAELTDAKPGRKPLAQAISEVIYS